MSILHKVVLFWQIIGYLTKSGGKLINLQDPARKRIIWQNFQEEWLSSKILLKLKMFVPAELYFNWLIISELLISVFRKIICGAVAFLIKKGTQILNTA